MLRLRLLLALTLLATTTSAKSCTWIADTDFSGGKYHPPGKGANMTPEACCQACQVVYAG
jgi:hypothetical protein